MVRTFNNVQKVKDVALERAKQGTLRREEYIDFGVPGVLARLEEDLSQASIFYFHVREEEFQAKFIEAIPVGADLSAVWPEFAIWLLTDDKYGVINLIEIAEHKALAMEAAQYYLDLLAGKEVAKDTWRDLSDRISSALAPFSGELDLKYECLRAVDGCTWHNDCSYRGLPPERYWKQHNVSPLAFLYTRWKHLPKDKSKEKGGQLMRKYADKLLEIVRRMK